MRDGAAEIGDLIVWGNPEDCAPVVYEVGPNHRLERVVDGLSQIEWVERDNETWATTEDCSRRKLTKGEISEAAYQIKMRKVEDDLLQMEGVFFADATADLDALARRLSQPFRKAASGNKT